MPELIKKKNEYIGLSPYALVFRGQKKIDKIIFVCYGFRFGRSS